MQIVSSSIIEVTNLNDTRPLQLFLSSSQSKTQIYNANTGVYTPDWNTSNPVLTSELYAGSATNIIAQAKSITWYDSGSAIVSGANYTLGTGNQSLTINKNLLTGKNLVPSFDSSRWFGDDLGAGKIVIDATDRYKMTLTDTASSQGRLVWIPVISGKTYTVSCNQSATTGIRKVYKSNVTSDVGANALATNNVDVTFTVDSSYNGYVTIRLVAGAAGSYVFQDVQMEEGSASTAFASMVTTGTKNITCEVVYTDPDTGYDETAQTGFDFSLVPSGQPGFQGNIAGDIGYLTNDTAVITTANDGTGGTYGAPNTATTLQIFRGMKDVTTEYTISQARTSVTVTEATTSATATVTAMSADTGSIVFTATLANYPTITKTFSLAKSKMGAAGNNPTDYWLNTSVSSISAADDGSYNPTTITFSAESQVGTNAAVAYTGRFVIAESTDGNNFTTKYTSAADESSKVYTPSAGLQAIKATLYQSGGVTVKLDDQTVPVVDNGKNSVTVSAWTPTGNIIRNAANTVTAQADTYNGGVITTASNTRWVKGNGAATSVIAGAGYEDLDLPKRNLLKGTMGWSSTYGWVSNNLTNAYLLPASQNYLGLTVEVETNDWQYFYLPAANSPLVSGVQYTASCYLKADVSGRLNPVVTVGKDGSNSAILRALRSTDGDTQVTTGWKKWYVTFTYNSSGTEAANNIRIESNGFAAGANTLYVCGFKIEQGSTFTAFSQAPEEFTVDPTDNTMYGRNWVRNGDFAITTTNSSVGWDNTLNGTLVSNAAWSNGYNGGVADPTHGYHAHLNSSKFGYPVLEFIDKNSTIGQPHRWLGLVNTLTSYDNFQFVQGQTYTLSYEVQTDTANMLINCGLYHYAIGSSTPNFNGFEWTFPQLTTTNTWIKQYKTFTVDNNWDVTKSANLYIYGQYSSVEGTMWVRNVKVELGVVATDFSNDPSDNSVNYPTTVKGANNWVFKQLGSVNGTVAASYSSIQAQTTGVQKLIPDGTTLVTGAGNNYTGYIKTAVYVSTAKTIAPTLQHDDGCAIMLNGVQVYLNNAWTPSPVTVTFNLQPGWNTIEFLYQQGTGGDGVYNVTPTIGSLVEEINCNYALDYGSLKGNYGIIGYNTNSMIVNTNAVTDTDLFQAIVTYRATTYIDTVTIEDVTDPITLQVVGASMFKNGQGSNPYTAKLYQNGAEIDPSGTTYTYTWYVYNQDGSQDTAFGGVGYKTGKTVNVSASDINVQGRLVCDVNS